MRRRLVRFGILALSAIPACVVLAGPTMTSLTSTASPLSGAAEFTDTFENGVNAGGWSFTTNPIRINQIEPAGGDPDAWFHGTENAGAPSVQTPIDLNTGAPLVASPFVGDYASRGVTRLSVDARTVGGDNDHRGFSVALYDWAGGDIASSIQAFTTIGSMPKPAGSWEPMSIAVHSIADKIPSRWTVLRGDGTPATADDWNTLMHHVDQVQFVWGEFGFAYPLHTVWDLGIDNVQIQDRKINAASLSDELHTPNLGVSTLVPEPTGAMLLLLGAFACKSRRQRCRARTSR